MFTYAAAGSRYLRAGVRGWISSGSQEGTATGCRMSSLNTSGLSLSSTSPIGASKCIYIHCAHISFILSPFYSLSSFIIHLQLNSRYSVWIYSHLFIFLHPFSSWCHMMTSEWDTSDQWYLLCLFLFRCRQWIFLPMMKAENDSMRYVNQVYFVSQGGLNLFS